MCQKGKCKSFDTASHIKDYTIDVYEKNARCRLILESNLFSCIPANSPTT